MKQFKQLFALSLFTFSMFASSAYADLEEPIQVAQLPTRAQQFIKLHFPNIKPQLVIKETEGIRKTYEFVGFDSVRIEFDNKGNWTDVEKRSGVPSNIVPDFATSYVNTHYEEAKIVKIERDSRTYDVELSNGIDLEFTKSGKLIDIDN